MKPLNEKFREIRESFGLSQTDLGERINKSQSAYGKLETGQTEIKISDIDMFSKALGMSIIDVFTYPEKWGPQSPPPNSTYEKNLVEEKNSSYCPYCSERINRLAEKEREINRLDNNINDLRKQIDLLEFMLGKNKRTGSE